MTLANIWSAAIGFESDENGAPAIATVVAHIRAAVAEAGFVSRGRITTGLKEAYRPLRQDQDVLAEQIDAALDRMLLSGDLEEHTTNAGRGYAVTPPRLIDWGGHAVSLLGASQFGSGIVRRFPVETPPTDLIRIPLLEKLGAQSGEMCWSNLALQMRQMRMRALFEFSQALAASGERYSLDEPNAVAVVSGRAEYFGRVDPVPSGRWHRVDADGFFPAAIRTGYSFKNVVLHVAGKETTLWQPPSRDIWRWIVVGQT